MARIAVVILNYNGISHLKTYLPSVVSNSDDADIVVIDNGSTDDSVPFIKDSFTEVRIIQLPENLGFCEGYNQGLKAIDSEYYVILNSDVEVTRNWLNPCIELMDRDNTIGACQPKILSWKNKTEFEYAGASGGFIDKYGYPFCRGRIFRTLETDTGQYNQPLKIFWASGAALFVRSKLFSQLGGFDSRFYAHMEEIDLCWRMQKLGFSVYCHPDSTVYHLGGGTLNRNDARKTYLNFRNNLLTIHKNQPASKLWRIIPSRILFDGIACIMFLFTSGLKHALAIPRAYFFMLRHLKVQKSKGDEPVEIYPKSIIIQYYLKKRKKFSDLGIN